MSLFLSLSLSPYRFPCLSFALFLVGSLPPSSTFLVFVIVSLYLLFAHFFVCLFVALTFVCIGRAPRLTVFRACLIFCLLDCCCCRSGRLPLQTRGGPVPSWPTAPLRRKSVCCILPRTRKYRHCDITTRSYVYASFLSNHDETSKSNSGRNCSGSGRPESKRSLGDGHAVPLLAFNCCCY